MNKLFIFIFSIAVLFGCQKSDKSYVIHTIGDSTMANKAEKVYPETGWGQVLGNYFDDNVTVANYAVNGRSSKSFKDEGRWQTVLDSIKPGDWVLIQFGHNDEKYKDSTRYTTPYGTYTANLEMYVNEAREKGATPVLLTPIVRRKFGEDGKLEPTHGDYPDAVRKVAEKMNVPLIDMQILTKDWVNNLGDSASKKMYLWVGPTEKYPKERKDDTHLQVEGANNVAKIALREAEKQNLGFVKDIKKDEL
ncbi:rhamnogalacturonan acetylesterase [Saccharicrinis sp. FJH62]|uniref:rhamnogalacturonan acetylesterase n=1 Tax=Saccharicrinis sp. FJH62 TaxID=3344657 RepID=UPI0035D451F0